MKETVTPNYYAIIPADVRYDKRLSPNAKLLYGEITALCNKEGYCWASNSYFAELYDCVPQSVSNWIKELMENGYIRTENFPERGNLRHIYILTNKNQENFDFEPKTTIQNNYIAPKNIIELSKSDIELSKNIIELSKNFISMNNTINTKSNITSNRERAPSLSNEDMIKLWASTWGRPPKIPEQEETNVLVEKFGIDKVKHIFREGALKNFRNFKRFIESLDNDGNIKPLENKYGTDQSVSKGSVKSRLDYKPDPTKYAKRLEELKLITGES